MQFESLRDEAREFFVGAGVVVGVGVVVGSIASIWSYWAISAFTVSE